MRVLTRRSILFAVVAAFALSTASDARHSEADIRRTLIEQNLIYAMLTLPSNMFYTVTLPATLWFFDKAKTDDRILFIDARKLGTMQTRTLRVLTGERPQGWRTAVRLPEPVSSLSSDNRPEAHTVRGTIAPRP